MKPFLPLALLAAPLAACGALSTGSDLPRGEEPMTNDAALVVYCAGLDALLADPRDAGLRRALSMADDRLLELPEELGEEPDVPLWAFELLADTFSAPLSLQLDPIEDADWSQGPQFTAQLTVHGTEAEVGSISSRFSKLLGMRLPVETAPAEGFAGMRLLPTPAGNAYFGVPAEDGSRFLATWGEPDLGELGLGSLDLPRGAEPTFAFKLDMGRFAPILETLLDQGDPEAQMVKKQLTMFGLLGDHPMQITAATARVEDRTWFTARYANWVSMAEKTHSLVRDPLLAEEISMVPEDATWAAVSKADLSSLLWTLETMAPEEDVDLLGLVRSYVGIDLEKDLINTLGTTSGFYMSETTGGGGIASAVLFMSVVDSARLGETIDTLQGMLNDLAAEEADGYVEIRDWNHGETVCHSLVFPGLPVPFELSFALTEDWLFAAATPQALVAGLDHANEGGKGLLGARRFREAAIGSLDDLTSLNYTDTVGAMADGYGLAGLLFSALANGVRSPESSEREPGMILPPYHELMEGACASVILTRIEGEDLVSVGMGDGSFVAGVTGFLGSSLGKLVLLGVGGGILVPVMYLPRMVAEERMMEATLEAPPEELMTTEPVIHDHSETNGG